MKAFENPTLFMPKMVSYTNYADMSKEMDGV
jgi:hypothetical protein